MKIDNHQGFIKVSTILGKIFLAKNRLTSV